MRVQIFKKPLRPPLREPFYETIIRLKKMNLIHDFQIGEHRREENNATMYNAVIKVRPVEGQKSTIITILNDHYIETSPFDHNTVYFKIPTRIDIHKLTLHELEEGKLPNSKVQRAVEIAQRARHLIEFKLRQSQEEKKEEKERIGEMIRATKTRIKRLLKEK